MNMWKFGGRYCENYFHIIARFLLRGRGGGKKREGEDQEGGWEDYFT